MIVIFLTLYMPIRRECKQGYKNLQGKSEQITALPVFDSQKFLDSVKGRYGEY